MADLSRFQNKISAAQATSHLYSYSGDPRTGFAEALASAGFGIKGFVDVDRLARLDAPDDKKPGKKSGWYLYTETDGIGIGVYGSWNGHPERETWCSKSPATMSAEEKSNYARKMEEARLIRDEELRQRQIRAEQKALKIWQSAGYPNDNAYLERKNIVPTQALRQSEKVLVIPIESPDGKITSLQYIHPNGSKKFLSGGRIKGCYHKIEGKEQTVYVVEGYATGVSIHMATASSVYVAFNAGNLYEVAAQIKTIHSGSRIVIAGDDDQFTPSNPGKTKALQAAGGLGIEAAFPAFENLETKPTDWNDLHVLEGLESVRKQLKKKPPEPYKPKEEAIQDDTMEPPAGFLRDVYNYYNATSGNKQPGFAIQTALALGSIILGRRYQTDNENFTSLYLLNIEKSGTGKEHCKKIIGRILRDSGRMDLLSGSGYSSGAGVMSALLEKPKHIAICDEFGRNLQAAKQSKDANYASANTKLMEAIGTCDGLLSPLNYSTMTLTKEKAKEFSNRFVLNPAITIVAMTTPVTFFEAIDQTAIMDGFTGRFIISISNAKREVRLRRAMIDTPQSVLEWIREASIRAGEKADIPSEAPKTVIVTIADEAYNAYQDFERYCIEQSNALEEMNMSEATNRTAEMAIRVALIVALSRDINAETLTLEDMQWAVAYIRVCIDKTIQAFKHTISGSTFESDKKAALAALRKLGEKGMTLSEMNKKQPFAKWKKRDREDVLSALIEADLIHQETKSDGGRPSTRYYAI